MACCDDMRYSLGWCDVHKQCPAAPVWQLSDGSYGIPISDGGSSIKQIKFCPWCGANLAVASDACAPLMTT